MNVTIKISVNKISIRETCSTFWKLCLRGRRIVTFLIIAHYKYSYLLTYLLRFIVFCKQPQTDSTIFATLSLRGWLYTLVKDASVNIVRAIYS